MANVIEFSGISRKEDNLARYTEISRNFLPGISVPFWLSFQNLWNFRLNGSLFGNSTISRFSGNFPGKFPNNLSPFRNFASTQSLAIWNLCSGRLGQGLNHMIIVTPSFSKSSVFKTFPYENE